MLTKLCEEMMSEELQKPKFSYELTLLFEPETSALEYRRRIGRFIGKNGANLNILQDKYNVCICIDTKSKSSDELKLVVKRENQSMTDTIPIQKIKEDINEQWEEASEIGFIRKQFTFDQNQFQFVTLSFDSNLSLEERHEIMGRFIGKDGEHLHHLEDQYNIRLHIIDNQSSNRKYFEKLIAVQDNNSDTFYLFITKKDKSMANNEIPIEQIKEQIIQQWREATIEPIDDELYHMLAFSYESNTSSRKQRQKVGHFIGRDGCHFRDLQDKYNVNIHIVDNSSRRTLRKKLAKIQDEREVDKLYLLITNKDKSSTNTIPIDEIEQDLMKRWTNVEQTVDVDSSQSNIGFIEFSSSDFPPFADATPVQQKQMLGEAIFPLVLKMQPQLAGKITGMLLELDNTELIRMLESPELLTAKVCAIQIENQRYLNHFRFVKLG